MTINEKAIAEGIRKGENRAVKEFYNSFGGLLTSVCSRYITNDDDVKDILQESMISIITNIQSFEYKGVGSLKAWSARIVVNHALGFLRQKKRNNELFTDFEKDIPDRDTETPPNIDDIPADDVLEMIRELPDGYRMVLNLYIIEGKSHKEISQLLGIKADSSASQLHRAKAILAKKITEYRKRQAL